MCRLSHINDEKEVRIYGTPKVHNNFFIFRIKFDYNLVYFDCWEWLQLSLKKQHIFRFQLK